MMDGYATVGLHKFSNFQIIKMLILLIGILHYIYIGRYKSGFLSAR